MRNQPRSPRFAVPNWWQRPLLALAAVLTLWWSPQPAAAAMDVAKQVLIGADFSGQELRGATFNLTNLRDATFAGSDLQGQACLAPNCRTPT